MTALTLFAASPALSLEVGTPGMAEGLSARIKAESHKIVAMMDRGGVLPLKLGGQMDDNENVLTFAILNSIVVVYIRQFKGVEI